MRSFTSFFHSTLKQYRTSKSASHGHMFNIAEKDDFRNEINAIFHRRRKSAINFAWWCKHCVQHQPNTAHKSSLTNSINHSNEYNWVPSLNRELTDVEYRRPPAASLLLSMCKQEHNLGCEIPLCVDWISKRCQMDRANTLRCRACLVFSQLPPLPDLRNEMKNSRTVY